MYKNLKVVKKHLFIHEIKSNRKKLTLKSFAFSQHPNVLTVNIHKLIVLSNEHFEVIISIDTDLIPFTTSYTFDNLLNAQL